MEDIKEKTADEMFEELGYKKSYKKHMLDKYPDIIIYDNKEMIIEFDSIYNGVEFIKVENYDTAIVMQELQAINKKCKELGWI